jgi:BlaI family transcriptional regulator, penicillinase repressor
MRNRLADRPRNLGEVERLVMEHVWSHGPCSAEACREKLANKWVMKEATVRTILRRLEDKGYLTHDISGRTFIYRALEARQSVAVRAVRHIIDRFCDGSVEQLMVGMVDHAVLDQSELERLARKIGRRKRA